MSALRKIIKKLKNIHPMSKKAVYLGAATMLAFYITAAFAYWIAPYANYANAMTVYRGCLEAAPASLAAGACAGFVGDLMLAGKKRDEDERDE